MKRVVLDRKRLEEMLVEHCYIRDDDGNFFRQFINYKHVINASEWDLCGRECERELTEMGDARVLITHEEVPDFWTEEVMPDEWADGERIGFLRGFAYALGELNAFYDRYIAASILDEAGFTWDQFIDADVDEVDLERIQSLFDEEE